MRLRRVAKQPTLIAIRFKSGSKIVMKYLYKDFYSSWTVNLRQIIYQGSPKNSLDISPRFLGKIRARIRPENGQKRLGSPLSLFEIQL